MCLRNIFRVSFILSATVLLTACSSGFDERTHLAGPNDSQYTPIYQQTHETTYGAARTLSGTCLTESVARRPFPSYVVIAPGENLCRIAKRYETTVQAIVDINRLPSPLLAVGSRLRLPSPQYYSHSPFGQLRRR